MKVLLPFHPRKTQPEMVAFVMAVVPVRDQHWVYTVEDDYAYHRAMKQHWREGETFAVIEHDVCPTIEQWHQLVDCREPWCQQGYGEAKYPDSVGYGWIDNGHPGRVGYPGGRSSITALGCTKFSAGFIERTKERVLAAPLVRWDQLDSVLFACFPYEPPHLHLETLARHIKPSTDGQVYRELEAYT